MRVRSVVLKKTSVALLCAVTRSSHELPLPKRFACILRIPILCFSSCNFFFFFSPSCVVQSGCKMSKRRQNNKQSAPVAQPEAPTSASDRVCTGVLTTLTNSCDLKIESFSMSLFGLELVKNTTLSLNYGRRYGLIGANGCGA